MSGKLNEIQFRGQKTAYSISLFQRIRGFRGFVCRLEKRGSGLALCHLCLMVKERSSEAPKSPL